MERCYRSEAAWSLGPPRNLYEGALNLECTACSDVSGAVILPHELVTGGALLSRSRGSPRRLQNG